MIALSLLVSIYLWTTPLQAADDIQRIQTPRGAALEVIRDVPATDGPHPTAIIAPGSFPNIRGPLIAEIAKTLVARDFVVFRFNWAYYVADQMKGSMSPDRTAENEDLATVLAMARHDSAVDKSRIVLVGKSLGSVVSWAVLRSDPDLRGAVLLTPVCHPETVKVMLPHRAGGVSAGDLYPDRSQEIRPTQWISGNIDPYCTNQELYKFLGEASAPAEAVIAAGGHSFEFKPEQPIRTKSAIEIVTKNVAEFATAATAPR